MGASLLALAKSIYYFQNCHRFIPVSHANYKMLKNADPESRRIFWLACVASVSARGRRESWDKSKK